MGELYKNIKTYLTEQQLLVFLCLLKLCKTSSKKNIAPLTIYRLYMSLCREYSIEPVFKRGIKTTLLQFETAGLIRSNKSTVTLLLNNIEPVELLEDFLKDPVFSKYKTFLFSAPETY